MPGQEGSSYVAHMPRCNPGHRHRRGQTEPCHPLSGDIDGVMRALPGRDECCPGSGDATHHQRLKAPEYNALAELRVVGKQGDP